MQEQISSVGTAIVFTRFKLRLPGLFARMNKWNNSAWGGKKGTAYPVCGQRRLKKNISIWDSFEKCRRFCLLGVTCLNIEAKKGFPGGIF